MTERGPTHPSDVSEERGWFDHLADAISDAAAKPPFFIGCLAFILVCLAVGPVVGFSHGWVDVSKLSPPSSPS